MIEDRMLFRGGERIGPDGHGTPIPCQVARVQIRWITKPDDGDPEIQWQRWELIPSDLNLTVCELCGREFQGNGTVCSQECVGREIEHQEGES